MKSRPINQESLEQLLKEMQDYIDLVERFGCAPSSVRYFSEVFEKGLEFIKEIGGILEGKTETFQGCFIPPNPKAYTLNLIYKKKFFSDELLIFHKNDLTEDLYGLSRLIGFLHRGKRKESLSDLFKLHPVLLTLEKDGKKTNYVY